MMMDDFDSPESPFIRISRSGESLRAGSTQEAASDVTFREPVRTASTRSFAIDDEGGFDEEPAKPARSRSRTMPKRLSEEEPEPMPTPAKLPKTSASRSTRTKGKAAAETPEADQLPLQLREARVKQDGTVRKRQVLGFCFVIAALLATIALLTYTPLDAAQAETKLSDIPAIIMRSDPVINAHADTVHNSLSLLGAMLADFLINKTIGYASIIYPIFFGMWSLAFFRFTQRQRRRLTLATTFFLATGILFSATIGTTQQIEFLPHLSREWSGAIGQFLGITFTHLIGAAGAFIVYFSLFVITLVFSIDLDIERTFLRVKGYYLSVQTTVRRKFVEVSEARKLRKELRDAPYAFEEEELSAPATMDETILEDIQAHAEPLEEPTTQRPQFNREIQSAPVPAPLRSGAPSSGVASGEIPSGEGSAFASSEPINSGFADPAPRIESAEQVLTAAAPNSPIAGSRDVVAGQPFLRVRPIPKSIGSEERRVIPRITRDPGAKLGEQARGLERLSGGRFAEENLKEEPSYVSDGADARASEFLEGEEAARPTTNPGAPADIAPAVANPRLEAPIDNISREAIISPLRGTPRIKRNSSDDGIPKPPAEVRIGNEKELADALLPHSVDDDIREAVSGHREAVRSASPSDDEENSYKTEVEGRRVIMPENPYDERLSKYKLPSISLLTPSDPRDSFNANDVELQQKGMLLRDKLATFGVDIENITVTPGPVVTLYEFTPAEGIKVSKVEGLTDDIALAMKARGIRIIAPIPGKGTIGVEIPNDEPKIVRISSMFESDSFRQTKMNLPVALGMTISGDVYVDDLNKMPHLLIAGATGSGKSVGVNGILASLLYAKSPKDVKFVIVDPKKIELSLYKKLRKHYLIVSPEAGEDIVTTPQFAVLALKAVEVEMERRYDKLAKAAVRSLNDYNHKVAQGKLVSTQAEQHYHLPYIVVIIDELADLMITAGREIEEPICRIAQMARAVGIHLILATQRPSVDVITGVIKANFPARMAYQVATRVDSRTILDSMGAEQLLGNGDMLYQPSGTPKAIRLQSPFISTEEVEAIVDAVASQDGIGLSYSRPWTLPSLKQKDQRGGTADDGARDELFEDAARVIVKHQQGSVSLLQRRLKVGYSRAARIVDELERAGIVGPFDGSKARQVLVETMEELELVLGY